MQQKRVARHFGRVGGGVVVGLDVGFGGVRLLGVVIAHFYYL